MKIAIIGSTGLAKKMANHRNCLELLPPHEEVRMPYFDNSEHDELGICEQNRANIEWADEVHLFWDGRSQGTVFDFGVCFGLRKPFRIIYMENKTLRGVMEKYAAECREE